jgi:hypothetical protein
MKIFLKIGKLLAILIFTVLIILITASFLLKDKVGFIILRSLNKNLSTKLEVKSYKLSLLRRFPKASLELKDVFVHSSPDFNASQFKGINTDTLLKAHAVSVEFKITDIIKGVYTIERISATNGKANFFTDKSGKVNYNIYLKNSGSDNKETIINLERINISDITAYYNSLDAHLIISGPVSNGRIKTMIKGSKIDFTTASDLQIARFELYDYKLEKPVPAKIDVNLQSSNEGILFRKATISIDNYDVVMSGFVSKGNDLDMVVTGKNMGIDAMRRFFPEKYLKLLSDYNPTGSLSVKSTVKGRLSNTSNPHVEMDWQLKNGKVDYKKSDLTFRNVSFNGHFSNGKRNNYETSSLAINDFSAKFGSSEYKGSAALRNLTNPSIDVALKGLVQAAEIKEFFNITSLTTAKGSAEADIKITNSSWPSSNITTDRLIDLNYEANVVFHSLTIGLQDDKLLFSDINGKLKMLNSVKAEDVRFRYKGQKIRIDGEFRNLPEWLSGRKVTMTAKADLWFDKLLPEKFMTSTKETASTHIKKKAISLPGDIVLDLNFTIDSLSYKTFSSTGLRGNLSYHPKMFSFKSVNMKSLNGTISGDGFVSQNKDKSFVLRWNFLVKNIDVNRAFSTFHNFGQSFLKSENIRGALSGSLSLLMPLDSLLNFNIKTLTAEGKYHLVNGALIDFDPVKQLSDFIEISELENITFDQLDNDFFIRNNYLYVPQMEVKSSSADFSVNGKHSFDNDYEYHVKILLSEILSRKRAKYKPKVTEFGVVEDDGLGRTSLLLKVTGKGEEAKVVYDMKAAGTEVKKDITKEKKTLKTILNQEYGWYKKDSTVNQTPKNEAKKPKVRIKWDDGDAEKTQ